MLDRNEYWNEHYVNYWKERVLEANKVKGYSKIIKGDPITDSDEEYLNAIKFLNPERNANILELGCGFGRSLPFLYEITKDIMAIDISKDMIKAAQKNYAHLEGISFHTCEAEKVPAESNSFTSIICYAVYDALYQDLALIEMNRLLKVNGRVLISGKNDNYHDNDDLAYIAEVNARKKHHPNYFTNINLLLSGEIETFGFEVEEIRFFERRGDTAGNKYLIEKPEFFYEYMMILKKTKDVKDVKVKISDKYSKTYHRKQNEER